MFSLIVSGIVIAVLLVIAFIIVTMFRVVVPANEVHIIQSAGSTTSYGKGQEAGNVYFNWPESLPIVGNVRTALPVSVFDVNLESYEAYDTDKLPFVVDITAFFRISDSNTAAQRVYGFEELRSQLRAILQGAARSILASSDIMTIMQSRAEYGQRFTDEVDAQLKDWGVETVKSIELMDIRDSQDSKVIFNIMARKKSEIEKDSRIEVANNQKAAEVAETQNKRDAQLAREQAQQEVGIREAQKTREVGLAREQAQQTVQESAKITTEKEMEVKRVQDTQAAAIAKTVTVTQAEEAKAKRTLDAEAGLSEDKLEAQGIKAKAEATANEIKVTGAAKADAAKQLAMADVDPQIELAKEIGENEGYQTYLIELRKVEMSEVVGLEQAKSLGKADLKVIANAGDVNSGAQSLMNIFTPGGGAQAAGGLEAIANSDVGQAVLAKLGVDLLGGKQ